MMVWIDQDLCTGDGICEEITPDVFVGRDDGLWVVKEDAKHFGENIVFDGEEAPDGAEGMARVPEPLTEDMIESAEECPGECIMIEPFNEEAVHAA
ncbi:MAG: ferredoxin [Actinobacteria bacterium]|nr:MAG: ferredoxin [Actinomycetota bacterium]